jgi:hypothetical protein
MKTPYRYISILALVAGLASVAMGGAGNRAGTSGATELLIPVGTRDIALGGSTIATTRDIEALYYNPAALGHMHNAATVYVSHMSYIADIGINYGAIAANFEGFGVVALNLKALNVGDIPVTTTTDPDGTGKTFTPQFFSVGLTYSRLLNDRIAVGLTTKIVTERMGDVSASGVAFDIGVAYDNMAAIDGLSLGIAVKNIGPSMQFSGSGLLTSATVDAQHRPSGLYEIQAAGFELPSSIEFGLGYRRSIDDANSLLLSGAFQSNNFSDDEYKLGLEYSFQDLFFVRGGYNFAQKETDERQFLFGGTFGAGVKYALGNMDITVDYAYRAVKVFDANHVFSVKLGF